MSHASAAATVRSIAVNPANFRLSDFSLQGDHTVPEGAKVLELKQCENCTCTFVREKRPLEARKVRNDPSTGWAHREPDFSIIYVDRGQRYCKRCLERLLQPEDQTAYKEQLLPQLQQAHYGSKLPRYDDSLTSRARLLGPKPRKRRNYGDWRTKLNDAFMTNGAMTYEAIQDVIGNMGGPQNTASFLSHAAFRLRRVGSAPRRVSKGPQPGLFLPVEMAREYFKTVESLH